MKIRWIFGVTAVLACLGGPATADGVPPTITVDENGNGIGTVGPGFLGADPGPGGLNSVLTYNLPFAGTQGDVEIFGPTLGDVVRFNGNGTLLFYSDTPPTDSLGDTLSPPGSFYTNFAMVTELGPEGNNGAVYTPMAGQPGSVPGAVVTYNFVSDGSIVPEPSTLTLLGLGGVGLAGYAWRRRKAAQ